MFIWEKLGKIIDPSELGSGSWMHQFAQSPTVVIFDRHIRVYFCSRPAPSPDGQYLSFLSYVDVDCQNLTNVINICASPALQLGSHGTFDEFGTNPVSAIRYENEIRVYYAGWTRCESVPFNAAIGLAISSDDGVSFTRIGSGPILSYTPDEPFLLGSPRVRRYGDKWYLWYVAGKKWLKEKNEKPEPVYKIRMASSDDGINWVKVGKDLLEDKLGENECQASPDVIYRDGKYHMFFSYRHSHNYRVKEFGYRLGYAWSVNLIEWHRRDEIVGIEVSEHGWDSEMINYAHVFALNGETYMIYQGNKMGLAGIGIAKLIGPLDWSEV